MKDRQIIVYFSNMNSIISLNIDEVGKYLFGVWVFTQGSSLNRVKRSDSPECSYTTKVPEYVWFINFIDSLQE